MTTTPHVLIIDDEEDFSTTLAARLELRGLRVDCAFSGERGLAQMEADWPDALLLDMRMPGMSGTEVLRTLREDNYCDKGASLPVIIITGHCAQEDIERVEELGIQGCHNKPVNFAEVLESLMQALG